MAAPEHRSPEKYGQEFNEEICCTTPYFLAMLVRDSMEISLCPIPGDVHLLPLYLLRHNPSCLTLQTKHLQQSKQFVTMI